MLFDTNVIMDALQSREPWCKASEKLILAVANNKIEGFLTAKELCDIWYLTSKIQGGENSQRKAQVYISRLCKLFAVLDTTSTDIEGALAADIADFEDAVMIETAKREGMDAIVTRDNKFKDSKDRIKVYSSSDLTGIIGDHS